MSHLSRIAEFVFGELSRSEMAEADQHLAGCGDCRSEVDAFRHTQMLLKTSPDVEPPRRMIFEAEKRSFPWRWAVPVGVAAAFVLGVLAIAPIQVQWEDSQVIIAYGKPTEPVAPVPVVVRETAAQPIDYERIVEAVRQSQQEWLAGEMRNLTVANARRIQQLDSSIAYLESMQRVMYRDTLDNASSIQLLAKSQLQE